MKNLIKKGVFVLTVSALVISTSNSFANSMSVNFDDPQYEVDIDIIGQGEDEGGHYIIVLGETQCEKIYVSGDGDGMLDH